MEFKKGAARGVARSSPCGGPFLVDLVLRLGHGLPVLVAGDGIDAVETCFAAVDEKGTDPRGDVLEDLCLTAGCMAELPRSARTTEAVASGRAGEGAAGEVGAKG